MKKNLFIILMLAIIGLSANGQECLSGGCANEVNQYPTGTLTPISSWQTHGFMNAGNYTLFSVTCGNTYEWTYCEAYGGVSTSWNAQLTLDYYPTTGVHQCFSDNVCGTTGNAPYIRWTSNVTGTVQILTSQSSCLSNTGSPYNTLAYRQAVGCTGWTATPTHNSSTSSTGFVGAFTVTTSASGACYFSVTSSASWINNLTSVDGTPSATQLYNMSTGLPEINTGSTGAYAQVNYNVDANTTCSSRTGYIYLYDLCNNVLSATYTITEDAKPAPPAPTGIDNGGPNVCSSTTATVDLGGLGQDPSYPPYNGQWVWYTGSCGGTQVGTGTDYYVNISNAGTYTFWLRAENTCGNSTCATTTVTVMETPVITQAGFVLTSNMSTGNQWNLNYNPIPSATSQNYTVTTNGVYTVTNNGCESDPITISTVGIEEFNLSKFINIYPNPTDDNITIEAPQNSELRILNDIGQLLETFATNSKKTIVDVSIYAAGIYFVEVRTEKGVAVKKFIKE